MSAPAGNPERFTVNDNIIVNPGVQDLDFGVNIGGWQGRIVEVHDAEQAVTVKWDAHTLRRMKPWIIRHCSKQGLDHTTMTLGMDEVSRLVLHQPAPATPTVVVHENPAPSAGAETSFGPHLHTLTRREIEKLADSDRVFMNGVNYLHAGRIRELSITKTHVLARIHGKSGDYHIVIADTPDGLQMTCSCPYDGSVCKHLVAVLLRFIETARPNPFEFGGATAGGSTPQPRVEMFSPRGGLLELFSQPNNLRALFAETRPVVEQAGKRIFLSRCAAVQYVDAGLANLEVWDFTGGRYKVGITNEDRTLRGVKFTCACSRHEPVPYAKCAHMVAAAYALQQHAKQHSASAAQKDLWEERITHVLAADKHVKSSKPRNILLFSLQQQSSDNWKLAAYILPTSLVSAALLENRPALQDTLSKWGANYAVREITSYYGSTASANALYGSPELSCLAQFVALSNYHHPANMLAFALPQLKNALLFSGDSRHPCASPILQVDPEPRPLQLLLEQEATGLRLSPTIPDGESVHRLLLNDLQLVSVNPLWILTGGRLLRVEGDSELLKKLLQTREILVPAAAKRAFFTRYLPNLLARTVVSGDLVKEGGEVDVAPVRRIYLTEEAGAIVVDLAFAYDAYEAPLDTSWPESSLQYDEANDLIIKLRRRCVEEETAWRALSEYGLKRSGDRFVLKQRVSPVDFLLRYVPKLQAAGYEVYGEEAIKSARVNRNQPKMRLVVSSGIDWFDVLAVVSYGELEVALSEIRKAIKQRQGYVKLPDGSLGLLPEEWLNRYRRLFAMGEATPEGVRLSKTQATLIDLALKNADASEVDAEYSRRLEQLRNFTQIETRPLPASFRGVLRHYQQTGYDWLHFLHDYGFGGCLADDMGVGKTVQALALLDSLYASGHAKAASLIVMPRSLLENWAREAARFAPDLRVLIHADGDRSDDHASFDDYHLVLTTYGIVLRDLALFSKYRFHHLVLDESQAVKNPVAQTARAVRLLPGDHRLALTGTPVENSTEELWSLFAFLNPGQLGSQEAFREQFAAPIQRDRDETATAALRALIHPFLLRRTKEQVTPELPPRTERLIFCDMSAAQRKLYQRTRDKYRAELLGLIERQGMQQARFKVLEGLLRLRQLANDPRLVDKSFKSKSSKFEALLETLEVLRDEGHKALVFSQFTSMLGLLRSSLDIRRWPYLYLDGKTQRRQELVDRFQADEKIPFFLISLKAGGTGLNLTAADYVIHIDPWWNPAVERQATDRTHRIGQERPVMVYKFIAKESVEEKILLLQERKRELVEQLISAESGLMKSLTQDDIAALFS